MLRADFQPDGGASADPSQANNFFAQAGPHQQQFALPLNNINIPPNHPGATGQRYYEIQRVNGNGGNGKGDGVAGPHKHDLARSDEIKKNSILRFLQKREKEDKKTQVRFSSFISITFQHIPHGEMQSQEMQPRSLGLDYPFLLHSFSWRDV